MWHAHMNSPLTIVYIEHLYRNRKTHFRNIIFCVKTTFFKTGGDLLSNPINIAEKKFVKQKKKNNGYGV